MIQLTVRFRAMWQLQVTAVYLGIILVINLQMKSRVFLYVSLAVDLTIAASKFIAAAFTGSASMLSEGVHSVIDAISQLLLIWGVKTSTRQADSARPFGYGKELYFWSFIVSLLLFVVGGCISLYEGLSRLKHPEFAGNPVWNYAVLAFAFVFNLVSMVSALKAFNTKDPSVIIVLLGDFGDLLGLMVAFLGIFLAVYCTARIMMVLPLC